MPVLAVETFDLGTDEPAPLTDQRRAHQFGDARLPRFAREADHRTETFYERVLRPALPPDIRRLNDLWERTRRGVLPMNFTHEQDGAVLVVFDEKRLTWRQVSYAAAELRVRLRRWHGG